MVVDAVEGADEEVVDLGHVARGEEAGVCARDVVGDGGGVGGGDEGPVLVEVGWSCHYRGERAFGGRCDGRFAVGGSLRGGVAWGAAGGDVGVCGGGGGGVAAGHDAFALGGVDVEEVGVVACALRCVGFVLEVLRGEFEGWAG